MRYRQGQAAADSPGKTGMQVRLAEFAEKHTGQGEYSALTMELAAVINLFGHWIWAIPSTANGSGSAQKLASDCPMMYTVRENPHIARIRPWGLDGKGVTACSHLLKQGQVQEQGEPKNSP